MPNAEFDVCIVTPGYTATNPRVTKEADALAAAGFRVRVVCSHGNLEGLRREDELIAEKKPWRLDAVCWSPRRFAEAPLFWTTRFRHFAARSLPSPMAARGTLSELGEGRVFPELASLAASRPARLYVGHYPTGLAAAFRAAAKTGARVAYDIEDLHTEEQPATPAGYLKTERIRRIEARYLPLCAYVTAVSEGVSREIARRYAVPPPTAVYNAFPWKDRMALPDSPGRSSGRLSLYWFSQRIGLDRGIEDAIDAMGFLKGRAELHLRGSLEPSVRRALEERARSRGVYEEVRFHDPLPAGELLADAAAHDVGLALERSSLLSRNLSVTNKLFLYILAGLAVAATDVEGQRNVIQTCPGTGFVYTPGDSGALAAGLERWACDPGALRAARAAALEAARVRWNWENESQKIVALARGVLSR